MGLVGGSARAPGSGQPGAAVRLAVSAAALLALMFIFVAALATLGGAALVTSSPSPGAIGGSGASAPARRDIPVEYLRLYVEAARRYGLDWAILAGIGKLECDHGRDPDPSCRHEGAVNQAGAGGPMQFLASTWRLYGVDGDGDGRIDRWDPADAIYAAANYLRASGAPESYSRALYAYNHSESYVSDVQRWAARYRVAGASQSPLGDGEAEAVGAGGVGALVGGTSTPVRLITGERAVLAPWDGHLALVPADVPLRVEAMVIAGNELQDLPYGPGGHPDPRGAAEEDCSSSVSYVLYRAGVRSIGEIVRDNPLAQDYVRWGLPGPGRWVSVYATTAPANHVFIVIAGLRLDTSHNGTDVGPNRDEDGPRWRLLDHLPTWARWSVRHPPGL
jgi:hypothetical protein